MGKRTNTAQWLPNQNRWQINVQKDGVRRSFTSAKPGRTGQREANAKADAWLDDGIDCGNKKVKDIYPLFLEDLQARTSRSNWRPVDTRFRNWALPVIGQVKILSLTDQKLQQVINNAYQAGSLSKKSLCNLRNDVVSFVKFCRKSRLTTFRPENIIIPTGAAKQEKAIFQPQDLAVLFTQDQVPYNSLLQSELYIQGFRLQVLAGFRPGELLGLQKSDRHGSVVFVQRSINDNGEITSGKNENARRSVVLNTAAQRCWDLQAQAATTPYLFYGVSQSNYRTHLARYCKYYNLPPVTPYGLRHTFVSAAKTLPAGMVKDLVGHSQQMDTFGVYGHALEGDVQRVSNALDSLFLQLLKQEQAL